MNGLRDALSKAGFKPSAGVMKHDAERINETTKTELQNHYSLEDLDRASSMREFKQIAKNILSNNPSEINGVTQKAHRFKDEQKDANRRFIWFFYELRDRIKKLSPEKHSDLLRKAFRKSGSTFEE